MDKICCVFKGDSAVDALRERDFTVEKVLIPFDRNREERILYRCKKCGGLVLFDYEEAAYFIVGENWDNAHVTASYYPVLEEDVRVEDGKTVFDWDALTARRHITAHYREFDEGEPPARYVEAKKDEKEKALKRFNAKEPVKVIFKKLPAPKKKADDVRLFAEGMQLDPSRDLSIGLPGVCRIVISYGEKGYRLELFPAAEGKKRRFAGGLGWEDVGMYLKGVLLEGKSAEDLPGKKREPSRKKTPAGEAPAMDRFEILTAIRTRPEDYLPLVDHARKFFESRSEWGEVNIGWNVGLLEGNRPWFAECWAEDGITVLTYYLSTAGIENKNRRQLIAVLEKAGIVKFADPQGRRYTEVIKHTDGKGDEFFAVNVVAGTEDASFLTADSGLVFGFDELNRYNAPQKD